MNENPYQNTMYQPAPSKVAPGQFRRVPIRPFDLFQRGYLLIKDQYWLFFGMTLVAMLIGSAVPFGIVMGPMLVGLHMALAQKADQGTTEFGMLFKGFDKFGDALIAMLIMLGVVLVVMLPVGLLSFFGFLAFSAAVSSGGGDAAGGIAFLLSMVGYVVVITAVSLLCYLPFLFAFQLIADQSLSGVDACKVSFRGAMANLGGLILYGIALGFVTIVLTMMCYFPVYLFMPISFASMFELYRDIFGRSTTAKP